MTHLLLAAERLYVRADSALVHWRVAAVVPLAVRSAPMTRTTDGILVALAAVIALCAMAGLDTCDRPAPSVYDSCEVRPC